MKINDNQIHLKRVKLLKGLFKTYGFDRKNRNLNRKVTLYIAKFDM